MTLHYDILRNGARRAISAMKSRVLPLREAGLPVAPAQDRVIRLLPPLIVGAAEIGEAVGLLGRIAAAMWAKGTRKQLAAPRRRS
jgi:acetylornithine/succinyldiaminopimelate/putrescine aminotransferase